LIEEILLKTRSKCVVIDPNSDFRSVNEVVEKSVWDCAKYNPIKRNGKLPCEKTRDEFFNKWKRISKSIYTNADEWNTAFEDIRLWWPALSFDIIAEDEDSYLRRQLYHLS
jgi:hypothetical protein